MTLHTAIGRYVVIENRKLYLVMKHKVEKDNNSDSNVMTIA